MTTFYLSEFDFSSNRKILFLGEGNFSFSNCLLKQLKENFESLDFSNVYASCFEKELSPDAMLNVNDLQSIGAEVLLAVDATKLEVTPRISSLTFDKIIFNFPHVGGKMKIHLNRQLLRDFFISASKILNPLGKIIVTLCSGQGGTGFDLVRRRWDDTWQIVEQAANSDFILIEVDLFPNESLPLYRPVGFRGREQKFSTASGVIHYFCKGLPVTTFLSELSLKSVQDLHYFNNGLLVSYVHKVAMVSDPLSRGDSPQVFLQKYLINLLQTHSIDTVVGLDLSYITPFNSLGALCILHQQKLSLRTSLLQVIPEIEVKYFLAYGLVFKKCSSDFSDFCARCHLIIKCPFNIIKTFVSCITTQFNFSGTIEEVQDEEHWSLYFQNENLSRSKVAWGNSNNQYITFDLDLICCYIFNVSVKQLWCATLELHNKILKFPSLYPLQFVFDISFALKKKLDFALFHYLLHNLPENVIESVSLVDSYVLSNSEEISYCFRLIYRSYTKPFSKQVAIKFHQNVVGKALVSLLDARIR